MAPDAFNAPDGPKLAVPGQRTSIVEAVAQMDDLEELRIVGEAIRDREAELFVELEEEIKRQHDLLVEAAEVYVEHGRLPNLPAIKRAWVDGEREAEPRDHWLRP